MLRLSRNGIGVLTSQYKSVLKKCMLLNMVAAGIFLFAPNAMAEDVVVTGKDISSMGFNIDQQDTPPADPDVAYIYYDTNPQNIANLTGEMFSNASATPPEVGGWVRNYGRVYVGEKQTVSGGTTPVNGTVISNKHNTFGTDDDGAASGSVDAENGGGAITNTNKYIEDEVRGATLTVIGSTFEGNSATEFTYLDIATSYQAVGGAISNVSKTPVVITQSDNENSQFVNNFTMQFVNAYGGGLYNGFAEVDDNYGTVKNVAQIDSTGTVFIGNHVGNEYLSSVSSGVLNKIMTQLHRKSVCQDPIECARRTIVALDHNGNSTTEYALTDNAFGGAVYNIGEYNSKNETYQNNYAIGMQALGGAIYNSSYNAYIEDTSEPFISDISSFNIDGDIKFEGNQVISYEPDDRWAKAFGGAIYNIGKMNFKRGTSVEFRNNISKSYRDSRGGAIMNDYQIVSHLMAETIGEMSTIQNAIFYGNKAITIGTDETSMARGGAIYNAGKLTIADATFTANEVSGAGTANNLGGAIYNGAKEEITGGYLQFDNENSTNSIVFENNKSQSYGGAIFNYGSTVRGVISQQMLFEGNEDAVDNQNEMGLDDEHETHGGGAIFNAVASDATNNRGDIRLLLVGKGNVLFKTHGYDNVYNDVERDEHNNIIEGGTKGLIQFGGKNFTASAFAMQSNGLNLSNVTTNATFLGTGDYELVNTQFVLGVAEEANGYTGYSPDIKLSAADDPLYGYSGYIGYTPTMKMAYNQIFLRSRGNEATHMYLSSDNDAVIDNDFYLDPYTVLRYDDKDTGWVATNYNAYGISDGNGGYVYDDTQMLAADVAADQAAPGGKDYENGTVNDYINFSKYFQHENDKNFYLGQYVENSGYIVYNDENRADSDIGIAHHLVNKTGGVIHSGYDGYITKNIHIGTLNSTGGKITINMDNTNLVASDTEHKLIPLDNIPEGYQFGYYEGAHYVSEVITIDKAITGDTIVVFYKEAAAENETTPYDNTTLDVGQRIYFAQTPGEYGVDLNTYSFNVENGHNPNYEIKVGYDYNDKASVYDWFLYRPTITPPPPGPEIPPEVIALIDLPRSSIEQLRSLRLPLNRTNKGQCNCYADQCDNRFCKFEDANFKARTWATPFYRTGSFEKPIDTDFDLFGVDFGLDFQPTTKDQIGFFGSYRNGKYKNDGNKKHIGDAKKYYSYDGSSLKLESWLGGAYYRRYIGDLYLMGAMFGGKIDADVKGKNGVKAAVDGVTVGAQAELGYDIRMTQRSVLTPLVRGTYNFIDFDKTKDTVGKEVTFGDIHNFEIEAALKLEYQFNGERELPTTGYIKPSVIQMLASGGEVTVDGVEYRDTLENETLGRIEVGFDAELVKNLSLGAYSNYSFGSDYDAWEFGGNVRIVW